MRFQRQGGQILLLGAWVARAATGRRGAARPAIARARRAAAGGPALITVEKVLIQRALHLCPPSVLQ